MNTEQKTAEQKRANMARETWIKNVMRIYPNKTREETEKLHDSIFNKAVTESYLNAIPSSILNAKEPEI